MADEGMSEDTLPDEAPARRSLPLRIAKWFGIALLGLLLFALAIVFGVNTDPGRRFVTDQINALEFASGLDIEVGRIDGSLYGELVIHELVIRDPRGIFLTAPEARLDWRPFAYLNNHIDIRSLDIPFAHLRRLPELIPSEEEGPLLPDLDIDIGRLNVARLRVDPPVTGQRHLLSLNGSARIADGRAQLVANAAALRAPGVAGGDRLVLRLDAVPEADRLSISARLAAPAGGFVTSFAGLDAPLAVQVGGRGSWSDWRGRAQATLGGRAFANLAVIAQGGTFRVTGPLAPALMLADGPARRMVEPFVQLDLVSTLEERRADTRLSLSSPAFSVRGEGLLDLANNRFDGVKVAARLLTPGAIAPNLVGRDVRLALVLNGAFATPSVAYELNAATLGMDGTILEGLAARGAARVDADRIQVPISARIRRVTGLNEAVGGLLTNVAVDGTLNIAGTRILSDNLRLRSDRLNATAVLAADMAEGTYNLGLQGRIDNYLIRGIGLLDIESSLDVVEQGQGFGIRGSFAVRTRRIDNESARDFLGGNAVIAGNLAMDSAGVVRIDNLRVAAPRFNGRGGGRYNPDGGAINFRLSGRSADYGPLSVVVTGTVTSPDVRLRATSPGFGIGLANIDARVQATGQGYRITATGSSDYGPFDADITILSGAGPLTVQVNRATIAGITVTGRLAQTAAGPFSGTLSLSGSGLDGTVRLSAVGANQRADISATANGARIPGEPPILIQRGIIQATAILYPNAPSIVADVQLAGVRRDQLSIETARARVDYRGGRGAAQLVAAGSSGVPYRIAANVALSPDRYRAAVEGEINRIAFRLARPAEITRAGADWVLAPTEVVFPQGNVRLSGRYGDGLTLQSRIDRLDLSIANAFAPNLGLGGTMSGTIDFAQPSPAAFPEADARLVIQGFTRTGVAVRSAPVNIGLVGQLRPDASRLAAVIRRGGAIIGRVQARLQPAGGGSWSERLLAGALTGGVRYNGPAEVLWSLSGIADQQVSGPIGIAADFAGRVESPQLNGVIRANDLTFVDENFGTRITNIALQGRFTNQQLQITQLSGRAGDGSITGSGSVGLAADAGFPIDIRLAFDDARLARSDMIGATATGNIAITNGPGQPALISGTLQLPQVRYQIIRQGAAEIAVLEGVRRKGEPLLAPDEVNARAPTPPSIWNLDLRVVADNQVFVEGMGLESEWETDLRVTGTSSAPIVTGTASVIRGTYSFAGNRFELTRGEVEFTGTSPIEPRLNIAATAELDDVDVTVSVTGRAFQPQIAFTSAPGLPQDEIISRLLFGGSVTELSALQLVQLGASLNSLRGGGGGLNPLGTLRSATGAARIRVLGADEATGRGTAVSAGFYLGNDIYLEVITDARGFTATQIEIALTRTLSILSAAGSQGGTNLNVRYRKQY